MLAESDSHNSVPQILALEREILRSLCSAEEHAIPRDAILRSLANHPWHDPEHRIVYEALSRIRGRSPMAVREELPATATRMGFPDVDWKSYFDGNESTRAAKIEALLDALISASGSPNS